jgi:hypothetical protein
VVCRPAAADTEATGVPLVADVVALSSRDMQHVRIVVDVALSAAVTVSVRNVQFDLLLLYVFVRRQLHQYRHYLHM